jgi:hypothetical protein
VATIEEFNMKVIIIIGHEYMWGLGGQQERRGRNEGSELVQGALYTYMK